MMHRIIKDFLAFFILVFLVAGTFFTVQQFSNASSGEHATASLAEAVQLTDYTEESPLEPLVQQEEISVQASPVVSETSEDQDLKDINAISALSIEFGDGVFEQTLFVKNQNEKLPIASLTKIMTVLIVLKTYDLDQGVVVSAQAMKQGGKQGDLTEGETLSIKDLLYIALIESSNRAAFALAEVVDEDTFIGLMNSKAQELELKNTHFADVTGLSEETYSTARDVARLSEYVFLNFPLFREIISLKTFDLYRQDGTLHHVLHNTNELLGQDNIVGGKTGYTNRAKGCFMVIQRESSGKYVVHIVLGAEDRMQEMQNLINLSTINYLLPTTN